jgi:fucose 4-O-acetylase-like acetyltransferase
LRDPSIDALRGIGIIMVVFSHVLSTSALSSTASVLRWGFVTILDLSNVQLLAFVSGMLFHRSGVAHRARTLLIPLLAWGAIEVGLAARFAPLPVALERFAVGVFSGGNQYWFLWALFLTLSGVEALWGRARGAIWVAVLIGAAVWPLFPAWTLIRGVGLVLPFVVLGIEWREVDQRRRTRIETLWLVFGAVMIASAAAVAVLLGGPLSLGVSVPWPRVFVAALGTVAGASACVFWLGAVARARGIVLRALARTGVASMGVYGSHGVALSILRGVAVVGSLPVAMMLATTLVPLGVVASEWLSKLAWTRRLLLGGRSATL